MKACIHRGAAEVGGSCVEIEHDGWRAVLDIGLPLDADPEEPPELPPVHGLREPDGRTCLLISHGHPDHYGLHEQVHPEVPIFMGAGAQAILEAAAFFTGGSAPPAPAQALRDREPISFGPFTITPFLADHSGFDAYSLLVEAGGRRLLYSGDIRSHGRKPGAFQRLLANPPRDVNVLVLEGTRIGADDRDQLTERDVEMRVAELCERTPGAVLVCYSPQNIDRLVSLFRASKRSGRDFVMDLYAATVAAATGLPTIPHADWEGVSVYLPRSQKARIVRDRAFDLVRPHYANRIYPEQLQERANRLVITFRGSMADELEAAGCIGDSSCVWSMWKGYLDRQRGRALTSWLAERNIPLEVIHASGHAPVADLQLFAGAVAAERVVPIHTRASNSFSGLFRNVAPQRDGTWWEI